MRDLTEVADELGRTGVHVGPQPSTRSSRRPAATRPSGSRSSTRSSSELDRVEAAVADLDVGAGGRSSGPLADARARARRRARPRPGAPRRGPLLRRAACAGCSPGRPATSCWPPTTPRCGAAPACRCRAASSRIADGDIEFGEFQQLAYQRRRAARRAATPKSWREHLLPVALRPAATSRRPCRPTSRSPDRCTRRWRESARLRPRRRRARGRRRRAAQAARGHRPGRARRRRPTTRPTSSRRSSTRTTSSFDTHRASATQRVERAGEAGQGHLRGVQGARRPDRRPGLRACARPPGAGTSWPAPTTRAVQELWESVGADGAPAPRPA